MYIFPNYVIQKYTLSPEGMFVLRKIVCKYLTQAIVVQKSISVGEDFAKLMWAIFLWFFIRISPNKAAHQRRLTPCDIGMNVIYLIWCKKKKKS
jgi:hypothetical protein